MTLSNRSTPPDWRGVHHLALVTPDMDATVRFYVGVLAMPLVATLRAGPMRHYFFELGLGNTIANTMALLSDLPTPVVSVIIGEGGSEGALAFGVADTITLLPNTQIPIAESTSRP